MRGTRLYILVEQNLSKQKHSVSTQKYSCLVVGKRDHSLKTKLSKNKIILTALFSIDFY
jgi:hypothetical protein